MRECTCVQCADCCVGRALCGTTAAARRGHAGVAVPLRRPVGVSGATETVSREGAARVRAEQCGVSASTQPYYQHMYP